jgi:excisionase family DNA binding protein
LFIARVDIDIFFIYVDLRTPTTRSRIMSGLDQYDNPIKQRIKSCRTYNRKHHAPAKKSKLGLDKSKFCTAREVAARWGVSIQTIHSLINRGDLEAFRLVTQYRIKVDSVLAFEVRNSI